MKNGYRALALVAGFMVAAAGAAEEKPARIFKPSGPWAMEYADQACRLIRNFSDGKSDITLAYERFAMGTELRLGLAGGSLWSPSKNKVISFRYGPDGEARESDLTRTVLSDGRQSFLVRLASLLPPEEVADGKQPPSLAPGALTALHEAEIAAARGISSIFFSRGFSQTLEIQLGPMAAPVEAMQGCAQDLVKSWGVDPVRYAQMSRPPEPVGEVSRWISSDDYPREKLVRSQTGIVQLRLIISEEGTVEKCVTDVERPGPFEEAVCGTIGRKGRFTPALDGDGQPMKSYWTSRISFVLP